VEAELSLGSRLPTPGLACSVKPFRMAKAGDVIDDPVTGQRIVFEATAQETDGEALRLRASGEPKGFFAQEHLHPRQSELHEVVSGQLELSLAGRKRLLGPGDAVVFPAGTRTA
jgi:quercetin dioxygenase-like cupin family protein